MSHAFTGSVPFVGHGAVRITEKIQQKSDNKNSQQIVWKDWRNYNWDPLNGNIESTQLFI